MVTVTSAAVDEVGAVGVDELPHALTMIDAPIAAISSRREKYVFFIGTTPLHTAIDRGKRRADGDLAYRLSFLSNRAYRLFSSGATIAAWRFGPSATRRWRSSRSSMRSRPTRLPCSSTSGDFQAPAAIRSSVVTRWPRRSRLAASTTRTTNRSADAAGRAPIHAIPRGATTAFAATPTTWRRRSSRAQSRLFYARRGCD